MALGGISKKEILEKPLGYYIDILDDLYEEYKSMIIYYMDTFAKLYYVRVEIGIALSNGQLSNERYEQAMKILNDEIRRRKRELDETDYQRFHNDYIRDIFYLPIIDKRNPLYNFLKAERFSKLENTYAEIYNYEIPLFANYIHAVTQSILEKYEIDEDALFEYESEENEEKPTKEEEVIKNESSEANTRKIFEEALREILLDKDVKDSNLYLAYLLYTILNKHTYYHLTREVIKSVFSIIHFLEVADFRKQMIHSHISKLKGVLHHFFREVQINKKSETSSDVGADINYDKFSSESKALSDKFSELLKYTIKGINNGSIKSDSKNNIERLQNYDKMGWFRKVLLIYTTIGKIQKACVCALIKICELSSECNKQNGDIIERYGNCKVEKNPCTFMTYNEFKQAMEDFLAIKITDKDVRVEFDKYINELFTSYSDLANFIERVYNKKSEQTATKQESTKEKEDTKRKIPTPKQDLFFEYGRLVRELEVSIKKGKKGRANELEKKVNAIRKKYLENIEISNKERLKRPFGSILNDILNAYMKASKLVLEKRR